MNAKALDDLRSQVNNEGFHYAFIHYSDFEDVKDAEFHTLRLAYIKATNELADYLNLPEFRR
jgi:hypothetical protein